MRVELVEVVEFSVMKVVAELVEHVGSGVAEQEVCETFSLWQW